MSIVEREALAWLVQNLALVLDDLGRLTDKDAACVNDLARRLRENPHERQTAEG